MDTCSHLDQIQDVAPDAKGCSECLALGDGWVHLRLCKSCGHVGCCDSSKNQHASKHAIAQEHPIVGSFEPDEDWFWCFVDEVAFLLDDVHSVSYADVN
jgi:Zn-finger in ubiquitin-hydrolases and other protein